VAALIAWIAGRRLRDAEVSKLKQELDPKIVICASHQLGRTLIEHDPVDELRLALVPVVLGAGERLFGETRDKKPCALYNDPRRRPSLPHLRDGPPHTDGRVGHGRGGVGVRQGGHGSLLVCGEARSWLSCA
jgi:hypothetical protein